MPALDLGNWPSPVRHTPPTAAPAAPTTTPARTGRGGGTHAASIETSRGGFDQLVDRLADAREEDEGVDARSPEPRAKDKDDAEPATAPASDPTAPQVPQTTFPWTLPLNPALWTLDPATDAGGDAEAGQQIDDAAHAAVNAAGAVTVGVGTGIGATQVTASLSMSLGVDASTAQSPSGAEDVAEGASSAFATHVEMKAAGATGASAAAASDVAAAPTEAYAEIGGDGTFATQRIDAIGGTSASGAAASAGMTAAAANANAADTVSLTSVVDAMAGARSTAATDGSQNAANGSAAAGADASQVAIDAAANATTTVTANAEAGAATSASASASAQATVSTDAAAGVDADSAAALDRARQQAMQELRRAMARAQAGNGIASDGQKSRVDANTAAQGTIATDGGAAAGATVTDRSTAIEAGAVPHVDATVAAQAQEPGRAKKGSKAEAAEGDDWASAAAAATGAASAEQATGPSNGASTQGRGEHGRGSDAHPANFGGLVSSLRHASEGGVHGVSPAFEARSLMAAANAGLDAHDASATAASTIVTTASPEEQAAQIVRSMRLQWRGSVGEAQLRLAPEHLGQVLVSVKVDQGSVRATMHAETPAAQQWIQAHQQQLRDALDAQGLRVAELQVTTDPEDRPRRDQPQDQERPRGRAQARARDGEAPRFEIRM